MKGSFGVRVYKDKACARRKTTARFDGDDGLFWVNGKNWDDNNVPCSADVTMIPKEQASSSSPPLAPAHAPPTLFRPHSCSAECPCQT